MFKSWSYTHCCRFALNDSPRDSQLVLHWSIISCKAIRDGDNNTRSSAYIIHARCLVPIRHPNPCFCKSPMISFKYKINNIGDNTTPCLTQPQSLNEPDSILFHLTRTCTFPQNVFASSSQNPPKPHFGDLSMQNLL